MTSSRSPTMRPAPISPQALGSLSHEFRTPLNGILGMARVLEGTSLTAEQRAYVTALRQSGEHLLTLVNDVLDFAKLGAGRIELRPGPVEVEALLRTVCELLSPRVREKGLEIAWSVGAGVERIEADEARLRQILLNFAGNAVKFTQSGGILVTAELEGGALRFCVEDTGPGVSREARQTIFEAFAQGEQAYETLSAGAGLGLAIARQLARAMGGDVGVDGARTLCSGGAAFWMTAPLKVLGDSPDRAGALAGYRVGVVSPSEIVLEGARRQIEASGGSAVTAHSLPELLESCDASAVLLIDEAVARGRRYVRLPEGRQAIILLAPESRGRIPRYRKEGFSGYLIKPLRRESLCARVLAAHDRPDAALVTADDDRALSAAAPGVRVLLVEDNPINALLARTLLSREGCTIDHARGGEEALAALQVGVYDLILMDMRMPDMAGVDVTRRLRALGVATPVVALTANAFEEDRHAAFEAGMNDFLVKPLAPEALRGVLGAVARGGWTSSAQRAKFA